MFKLTALLLISSAVITESKLRASSSKDSIERKLLERTKVSGECTTANFIAALGTISDLANILGWMNSDLMEIELQKRCAAALKPTM